MMGSKLFILVLLAVVLVEAIEAHRRCKSSSSSEECCPCKPKKCPTTTSTSTTSTTSTTTTTTPRFGTASTKCSVNFRKFPCNRNNECQNRGPTVYCCCGGTTDAVLLPNQTIRCSQYFNNNQCSAINVTCQVGCDSEGFCVCNGVPAPSLHRPPPPQP